MTTHSGATTLLEWETGHGQRSVDQLLSAYSEADRLEAIVRAISRAAQRIEDDAYNVLVSTILRLAGGDALDQWGEAVGEKRRGLRDPAYRRFIRARIQVNRYDGTTGPLIDIYRLITAAVRVHHWDHYPAGFRLVTYRSQFMEDSRMRRVVEMMNDAKPAGVDMTLTEAIPGSLSLEETGTGLGGLLSRTIG